jgi:acyl carrier protein
MVSIAKTIDQEVERIVLEHVRYQTSDDDLELIDLRRPFEDLTIDSLDLIEIVMMCEDDLDPLITRLNNAGENISHEVSYIPEEIVENFKTPYDIIVYAQNKLKENL